MSATNDENKPLDRRFAEALLLRGAAVNHRTGGS
jgi:hypothetical protein